MTNWARRWLVWYGTNLVRYVACILAVVAALLMLAVIGLRPGDGEPPGAYAGAVLAINLFFLFSVTIYLMLFGVLGRWGWPRLTAVLLIPVLWSVSPFLATLGAAIPVAAMWIALVLFAAIVEPPPARRARQNTGRSFVRPSGWLRGRRGNPVRSATLSAWLQWCGRSAGVLAACVLGGLMLMLGVALLELQPDDADRATYGFFALENLLLPLSVAAFSALFALFGHWGRRPRVWAFVLLPIFGSYVPFLALFPLFPPTGAMWLALLVFASFVELPPYRHGSTTTPSRSTPVLGPGSSSTGRAPASVDVAAFQLWIEK